MNTPKKNKITGVKPEPVPSHRPGDIKDDWKKGDLDCAVGIKGLEDGTRLYLQNQKETLTVQFKYKVGDPKYFEFVDEVVKYSDEFIPEIAH